MKQIILLLSLFLSTFCYGQSEIPVHSKADIVLHNELGRYTYKYLPEHKISHWVGYTLVKSDMVSGAERSDSFVIDPQIKAKGIAWATSSDYTKTGYDRGHLLPSADRSSSAAVNKTTFYMSNVAPQLPGLNRGVWKSLEEQVRDWAASADTVFVVVGTILDPSADPKTIGRQVSVPDKFFKAIMIKKKGSENKIHCYVMPNTEGLEKNFNHYTVSLEELEKISNIDLIWNNHKN